MTTSYDDIFAWLAKNDPASAAAAGKASAELRAALAESITALKAALSRAASQNDFDRVDTLNGYCRRLAALSEEIGQTFAAIPAAEPAKPALKPAVDYDRYCVDRTHPHSMDEDFTNTKICAFELCGELTEAGSWQDAVVKLCALMAQRDPKKLRSFVTDPQFAGKKLKYFLLDPNEQPRPERAHLIPGTDVYVWTNLSAENIIDLMRKILRAYGLPAITIYLRADYTGLHTGK